MLQSNAIKVNKSTYFENLDGLRTVAFLLVFLQHSFLSWTSRLTPTQRPSNPFFDFIAGSGGLGVSVFFVLSGFLITYLLLHEKEVKGSINILFFYMRRILRIWPLYYAVLIFAIYIYPYIKVKLGNPYSPAEVNAVHPLYYFTFLSNFDVLNAHQRNGGAGLDAQQAITWSVAVEEQFYLIWPLLFYFTPRKFYKFIFIALILACQLFRIIYKNDGATLYYHSLSVASDLAVGGFCGYYAFYTSNFRLFLERLKKIHILLVYLFGCTWVIYGSHFFQTGLLQIGSRFVNTLFFAFIILEQNYSTRSFYKFSSNKPLSVMGKYTYGLYLLHPIAIRFTEIIVNKGFKIPVYDGSSYYVLQTTVSIIISIIMSYLSYEFFEKQFLKLKGKYTTSPKS